MFPTMETVCRFEDAPPAPLGEIICTFEEVKRLEVLAQHCDCDWLDVWENNAEQALRVANIEVTEQSTKGWLTRDPLNHYYSAYLRWKRTQVATRAKQCAALWNAVVLHARKLPVHEMLPALHRRMDRKTMARRLAQMTLREGFERAEWFFFLCIRAVSPLGGAQSYSNVEETSVFLASSRTNAQPGKKGMRIMLDVEYPHVVTTYRHVMAHYSVVCTPWYPTQKRRNFTHVFTSRKKFFEAFSRRFLGEDAPSALGSSSLYHQPYSIRKFMQTFVWFLFADSDEPARMSLVLELKRVESPTQQQQKRRTLDPQSAAFAQLISGE